MARIEAAVAAGRAVAEAFASVAAVYEREAVAAEGEGHTLTAREHGWRAALALHFAAVHGGGREARRAARAAYARWAPRLSPPARLCRLGGVAAYARSPAQSPMRSAAVLVPPAWGGKEELRRYEERLLARGLATVSVDGPGRRGRDGWEAWWGRVAAEAGGGGPVAVWAVGGAAESVLAAARVAGVAAVAVGDAPARGGRGGPLWRALGAGVAPVAVVPGGAGGAGGLVALGAPAPPGLGDGRDDGGELALDLAADWLVERVRAAGPRGEG
ncbi:MAG: hypothetical protein K6V73_08230 [Firmicutes bacterium]|nr:hypothetical protein [Bacillota bacterium]